MTWINVVEAEEAEGVLKEIYDEVGVKSGPIGSPFQQLTNNPAALRAFVDLGRVRSIGDSPLSRLQREMIVTLVSNLNRCLL